MVSLASQQTGFSRMQNIIRNAVLNGSINASAPILQDSTKEKYGRYLLRRIAMARRTRQQIQEDNAKLLKEKAKALAKLNSHLDEISSLSEKDMSKVNGFINLFLQCETVYKALYPEMKRLKGEDPIDVRQLKFNIQYFEAALRFFGIPFDHEKMNEMFYSRKSYLTCRDKILHGLDMESINQVLTRACSHY